MAYISIILKLRLRALTYSFITIPLEKNPKNFKLLTKACQVIQVYAHD